MEMKSFLTINQFKKQLDYLIKNYTIISTQDLVDINKIKNEDYAILTFDDGLLDHYEVASILMDKGVNGTFLIPTLPIRDRVVMKSHKIQFILSLLDERMIIKKIFNYLNLTPSEEKKVWNKFSISKWKNNWWSNEMVFITNILRNHERGSKITNKLFKEFVSSNEKDFCKDFYLTENQVKDLVNNGMEVGGHGYLSESLVSLNQEKEISKSLEYIKKFHDNDLIFSYPNGSYNNHTLKLMKKYSCKFSYTTIQDLITKNTNYLEIPRFDGPQTLPL
tara:strand:- start:59 stop:889 length:831 start_codon:yes stop_codon:yes gene_type:complete